MDLVTKLGTALYETHGKLCQELIDGGYDLDNYYDGGNGWGNFDKVLVMVAVVRGARSYDRYVEIFEELRQEDDRLVSPVLFSRLTGIRRAKLSQTERTQRYRQNQSAELAELRALRWIDEHTVDAVNYIRDKYSNLL